MRGAVGPILTTGVALATAGVVVANPIKAPSADVQIPAVSLSAGSNDAVSMLDDDFLEAIEPKPSRLTNPFTLLRDFISTLAADATHVSKNAIMEAFVAGVTAVSEPELTAVITPYAPPATVPALDAPVAQVFLLPGLDLAEIPLPTATVDVPDSLRELTVPNPSAIVASLAPAVERLVTSTIDDVRYVGGELLAAAFAAGTAVAAEPVLIAKTLLALVNGDLDSALDNAVQAVVAPLKAPSIIINAFQDVVERRIAGLSDMPSSLLPASPSGADEAGSVTAPVGAPATAGNPAVRLSAPLPTGVVRPERGSKTEAPSGVDGPPESDDKDAAVETTAEAVEASVEVPVKPAETAEEAPSAAPETIGAAQLRAESAEPTDSPSAVDALERTDPAAATPRRGAAVTRGAAAIAERVSATATEAAQRVAAAAERAGAGAKSAAASDGDSGRS